jgi:hypothetical protein
LNEGCGKGLAARLPDFVSHPCPTPEARVVIVTAPGEEAQVDYGTGPMVRDPENRQVPAHAVVRSDAGHSRKSVRLLVFRSSTRVWAELHEKRFAGWAA